MRDTKPSLRRPEPVAGTNQGDPPLLVSEDL
jgi:hypothetical protein